MSDDPQWLKIAKSRLGIAEVPGSASNPVIIDWATQIGVRSVYTADSVAWCGLFVGNCMFTAGYKPVAGPLSARSWMKFGKALSRPSPGAILVFPRGSNPVQGHVCFYVSENDTHYHVLGGNQGDKVCYANYRKGNLLAIRWPDTAPNPKLAEVFRDLGDGDVEPGPDAVFEQRIRSSYGMRPAGTVRTTVVYTDFETGATETVEGDPTLGGGSGKKTARVGDPCTHGATVKTGAATRFVEGQQVARIGDLVDCPQHGTNKIVTGSSDVFVEGKGVAYVGSKTECGAEITDGASTVFTNPKSGPSVAYEHEGETVVYTESDLGHLDDDEESDDGYVVFPAIVGRAATPAEIARSNANFTPGSMSEEDNSPPGPVAPLPASCFGITDSTPLTFKLSPHFTLGDLTTGTALSRNAVRSQHGLSKAQIICNLRALAVNCLEPLAAKYGRKSMIITSGFRTAKPSGSQHERGEAADIQFAGISDDEYWRRAQWVRDNVGYDQFILEYIGSRPWLHLSYRTGRVRRKVNTCTAPGQYPSGLKKMR